MGGGGWGGDCCTYRQIRYSVSIGISLEDVVISRFQHRYALKKSKSKQKYAQNVLGENELGEKQ